jgi:glucosamine-phosphate N-acetyltransferase
MLLQVPMTEEMTATHEVVGPVSIPDPVREAARFEIKPLWGPDLGDSFVATMECLSPVGMTHDQLVRVFNQRLNTGIRTFIALVGAQVIGTASLHVLPKLAHQGRPAGLIEDVVVQKGSEHRGVGRALVQRCISEAHKHGCYKITLDCKAELAPFYALAGFAVSGVCMRLDLEVEAKTDSDRDVSQTYSY